MKRAHHHLPRNHTYVSFAVNINVYLVVLVSLPFPVVQIVMHAFLLTMFVNEILVVHIQNTFSWSSI